MKSVTALLLTAFILLASFALSSCSDGGETSKDFGTETSVFSAEESDLSKNVGESVEYSASISESGEAVSVFADTKYSQLKKIKYVAFGDSIARGYGLKDPIGKSYPALIASAFRASLPGAKVDFTNYGVDGMTTAGLIELLDADLKKAVDADIVTVCIGANNLLGTFLSIVEEYYPDIVPARGEESAPADVSGNTAYSAALIEAIRAIEARIESEEFSNAMEAGIERLKAELPKILDTLKQRAPDAEIYVTTVYSPYHGINLSMPYIDVSLDMGALSDKWVSALNMEIKRIVSEQGCYLVDPYAHFEEKGGLVNAGGTLMPFNYSFDPHPNLSGHAALANLHIKEIVKSK